MNEHDVVRGAGIARRVINQGLAVRIRQISRVVTARYDNELREIGITANQLTILSAVATLESVTQTDLQPYMMMEASTLSRNAKRMTDQGWLAAASGADRRSHELVVTPAGFRVLAEAEPAWVSAQKWATKLLGSEEAVRTMAHRVNPRLPL